jgi:MFS superfamily sulfate permease-like transporter
MAKPEPKEQRENTKTPARKTSRFLFFASAQAVEKKLEKAQAKDNTPAKRPICVLFRFKSSDT